MYLRTRAQQGGGGAGDCTHRKPEPTEPNNARVVLAMRFPERSSVRRGVMLRVVDAQLKAMHWLRVHK